MVEATGDMPVKMDETQPAGLANCGATCYLNSMLQVLHASPLFRSGVYSADGDARPLRELQRVFARLEACGVGWTTAAGLVEALGLSREEQQDPVEFVKLYLTLLVDTHKAKNALTPLNGMQTHHTTCNTCHTYSDTQQPFTDVPLPIPSADKGTLAELLRAYTAPEDLTGSNQWHCPKCAKPCDARAHTTLTTLPPLLFLHLLRFQYDPKVRAHHHCTN